MTQVESRKQKELEAIEKKLIAQMKNVSSAVCSDLSPDRKVYMVLSTMTYLNALVDNLIEPYKEEAKKSEMVQIAYENLETIKL